jgi:hypothetical protein
MVKNIISFELDFNVVHSCSHIELSFFDNCQLRCLTSILKLLNNPLVFR